MVGVRPAECRVAHPPDNTINAALRRLGYSKEEQTGHGFRSMASTLLNEQGFPPDVIEPGPTISMACAKRGATVASRWPTFTATLACAEWSASCARTSKRSPPDGRTERPAGIDPDAQDRRRPVNVVPTTTYADLSIPTLSLHGETVGDFVRFCAAIVSTLW